MPKVLPEYLEQRRQQILDAAAACFARKGFHHSTMQDICEEAELSPGAVYRYFPSKEDIIEAMCARGRDENAEAVRGAMARGDTTSVFRDLIDIFFLNMNSFHADEICALNIELISEATRNEFIREYLTKNNNEICAQFLELIQSAQARGEINPSLEADAVSRVMMAVYHGFITQRLVDPNLDANSYGKVLQALFTGGFWQAPSSVTESPRQAALQH